MVNHEPNLWLILGWFIKSWICWSQLFLLVTAGCVLHRLGLLHKWSMDDHHPLLPSPWGGLLSKPPARAIGEPFWLMMVNYGQGFIAGLVLRDTESILFCFAHVQIEKWVPAEQSQWVSPNTWVPPTPTIPRASNVRCLHSATPLVCGSNNGFHCCQVDPECHALKPVDCPTPQTSQQVQ